MDAAPHERETTMTTKTTTRRPKLTALEAKVFMAMIENAKHEAGGDFGIIETLTVDGMNRQTLGGYITALSSKGLVDVEEPYRVNGPRGHVVTQFTFRGR